MDELARSIGWWVIIACVIYVVGKLIISHGDAKQSDKEKILSVLDHERRLAYRKIWRSTTDPRVHAEVKFQYGSWALLNIELSDDEYDQEMSSSETYRQALRNVKENGYVCTLEAGKIVSRPAKGDA